MHLTDILTKATYKCIQAVHFICLCNPRTLDLFDIIFKYMVCIQAVLVSS